MKSQRRFAPISGLFRPESVACSARIRSHEEESMILGRIMTIGELRSGSSDCR